MMTQKSHITGKLNMRRSSPLVSVIIPTHNRPDFLTRTIGSILDQTYSNLEIIVVSNGCSQDNKTTVQNFNDQRLTYLEQENSGSPASPRNNGIRKSTGQYIAFCDDDDLWLPEKIEKQVAALESDEKYGLCYTKKIRFDENKEWIVPHEEGAADFKSLLYTNTIPISSILVRKSLIDEIGNFSESKKIVGSEDYEFLLRLSLITRFYFLDEYLIKYWSGGNRITKNNQNEIKIVLKKLITRIRCYLMVHKAKNLRILVFITPLLFNAIKALKATTYISLKKLHLFN